MSTTVHLQCLLGLQCADFAMVAADQTNTQSIIVMKNDENKLHEITSKMLIGAVGDSGDAAQFAQFVSKNLQLYVMRNKYDLNTAAVVHFTRKNLADGLRDGVTGYPVEECKAEPEGEHKVEEMYISRAIHTSETHFTVVMGNFNPKLGKKSDDELRNPFWINMLIAGHDDQIGGQLYSMDFLASSVKVPFAVHGFGGHLCMGILDRYHKYTLTEAEAYDILKLCVQEIHQRLFISLPNFQVKVVSKNGIRKLPVINAASIQAAKSF